MDGDLDTSSPSITGSVLTGYLLQFRLLFARNHCLAFSLLFGETKALALARVAQHPRLALLLGGAMLRCGGPSSTYKTFYMFVYVP